MKQKEHEKHERYYFQDGDLTLLVDKTLFRIHKHILCKDSPVFADMLTVPPSPHSSPEGSTEKNPIKLLGQNKEELEAYLRIIYYPLSLLESSNGQFFLNGIRFADKWGIDSFKLTLFKKLASKDVGSPAQVIAAARILGDELKEKEYLVQSYVLLMSEAPTDNDVEMMCKEDLALILRLRTHHKKSAYFFTAEEYVRAVVVGGIRVSDTEGLNSWKTRKREPAKAKPDKRRRLWTDESD